MVVASGVRQVKLAALSMPAPQCNAIRAMLAKIKTVNLLPHGCLPPDGGKIWQARPMKEFMTDCCLRDL